MDEQPSSLVTSRSRTTCTVMLVFRRLNNAQELRHILWVHPTAWTQSAHRFTMVVSGNNVLSHIHVFTPFSMLHSVLKGGGVRRSAHLSLAELSEPAVRFPPIAQPLNAPLAVLVQWLFVDAREWRAFRRIDDPLPVLLSSDYYCTVVVGGACFVFCEGSKMAATGRLE